MSTTLDYFPYYAAHLFKDDSTGSNEPIEEVDRCSSFLYSPCVLVDVLLHLVPRITAIAVNILSFPFLLCFPNKCNRFKYHLLRLILDPLHVVTGILYSITRIAATILGCCVPWLSTPLFRLSRVIDAFVLSSHLKAVQCAGFPPPKAPPESFSHEL